MQIAQLNAEETLVEKVGDYRDIFNQTSFPPSGPSDDFLAENHCIKCNEWLSHDRETQKLQSCDPYIKDGWCYLVVVVDLTDEEIEARRKASVPSVVSMRQARLALLQSNLLEAVNTAIASADEAVRIEWEYATEVRRDHALVQTLSVALGLTELQLDELFTLAATL